MSEPDLEFDLRLELRVKNGALWNAIHQDCKNVAEFCRKYLFAQSDIGYASMTK